MNRRLAISLAFVAVCLGVAVVPAIYAQVAQQNCCLVDAAGGVTSLNTLTGDITLTSTNGSVTITPSGQTIDLSVASGAGTFAAVAPLVYATPGGVNTFSCTKCASVPSTAACVPTCGAVIAFPSPNPTSSPNNTQTAYAAVQGMMIDCNGPIQASPSPGWNPSPCPNTIIVANGNGQCENQNYTYWGTSTGSINGVAGQDFAVGCFGFAPDFTIGGHGDVGIESSLHVPQVDFTQGGFVEFPQSSLAGTPCYLKDDWPNGVALNNSGDGSTCTFLLSTLPALSVLALNASNQMVAASSLTTATGTVTCAVTSGTSCAATATVRSGANCTATMETSLSTLAGPYDAPSVHTATTTLTVTMTAVNSGSGNLAAVYQCL